jgi:hypothetical protein
VSWSFRLLYRLELHSFEPALQRLHVSIVKKEAVSVPCKFYLIVVVKMNCSAEVCGGLRESAPRSAEVCDGLFRSSFLKQAQGQAM